ncbi:methionine-R-sulfoxide reductase B3 isoform X4 [Callithrix jacchus]|uniref:methionine-R-sulfoxide reductase B3 isoform X3 n=1 Tax=Callithrix jacchus TaxID=9483 RepID=UPI0023DCEDA6|nr:methionine-R-sulfoxide reductase B3 isoform X3 [Callithrix jacchus]
MPAPWQRAAGNPGALEEEEEELEDRAKEEGVGGRGVPGSGPRPRPARSTVLPRSSPMLIFGLGGPCPGISRHASRRPVRRPEPGREGERFGQRRRLLGISMSPRQTLPRPLSLCLCPCLCLAAAAALGSAQSGSCRDKKNCKVVFSQQELRKRLTPLQYHVTQEKGTESAFEGEYTHHKDPGIYKCVVCGTPLFKDMDESGEHHPQQTDTRTENETPHILTHRSETKFDSGSGVDSNGQTQKTDG